VSWIPALKALCIVYVVLVWAMLVWPKRKNHKRRDVLPPPSDGAMRRERVLP
jgi:hypothetical protein